MPCIPLGSGGFACSRGPKERCSCGKVATKLCDFPLAGTKRGATCDKPLCGGCAVQQAAGVVQIREGDGAVLAGLVGTARVARASGRPDDAKTARQLHEELLAEVRKPDTIDYCPAHAWLTEKR